MSLESKCCIKCGALNALAILDILKKLNKYMSSIWRYCLYSLKKFRTKQLNAKLDMTIAIHGGMSSNRGTYAMIYPERMPAR